MRWSLPLIIAAFFCVLACNGSETNDQPKPATSNDQPGWVERGAGALDPSSYNIDSYVFGTGSAQAREGDAPRDLARKRAMAEIAEGVAVSIAARFERVIVESQASNGDYDLQTQAKQFIQSDTALTLEGFEVVEEYRDANGQSVHVLGRLSRRSLDQQRIRARLEQAWRQDPNVLYAIGVEYESQGDDAQALASYQRSLKLRPGDARVQLAAGSLLKEMGKADDALVHFNIAAALAPQGASGELARLLGWGIASERINQQPLLRKDLQALLGCWWLSKEQFTQVRTAWLQAGGFELGQKAARALQRGGYSAASIALQDLDGDGNIENDINARALGLSDALRAAGITPRIEPLSEGQGEGDRASKLAHVVLTPTDTMTAHCYDAESNALIAVKELYHPVPDQAPGAPSLRGEPISLECSMVALDDLSRRWFSVRSGELLRSGQEFRINLRTNKDAWVYAVNFDAQGGVYAFWPPAGSSAPQPGNNLLTLPQGGPSLRYQLDAKTGEEELLIVASLQPLPAIESLLAARSADERLPEDQADALELAVRESIAASEKGVAGVVREEKYWLSPGSEATHTGSRTSGFGSAVYRLSYLHQ